MSDYDYVIVGAGSAGCVLADRLSAEGAEVLLVEAGGRDALAEDQDPRRLRPAVPDEARLGLRERPGARLRRPLAVRSPRQGARRIELDERDALRARASGRLRRLARRGLLGLGLGRGPALLPALRASRGRRRPGPRDRRPAQRRPSPQPSQAHRPDDRRRSCPRLLRSIPTTTTASPTGSASAR